MISNRYHCMRYSAYKNAKRQFFCGWKDCLLSFILPDLLPDLNYAVCTTGLLVMTAAGILLIRQLHLCRDVKSNIKERWQKSYHTIPAAFFTFYLLYYVSIFSVLLCLIKQTICYCDAFSEFSPCSLHPIKSDAAMHILSCFFCFIMNLFSEAFNACS